MREALDAYQADLISRGGDVHNVTRVREHLSNTLNAKTVALLTARELRRFRDNLLAKKLRPSSVNRINNALRAALNLAAAQDQRINNQTAWRIGLTTIFDAVQARNVILSDQVIRNIIAASKKDFKKPSVDQVFKIVTRRAPAATLRRKARSPCR